MSGCMNHDAVSSDAQSTVRSLRALSVAPLELKVTGEPARYIDQQTSIGDRLPAAFILLVVTSLAVLLLLTGSVVLPIKALLMNLLSLGATFGVLVLVFALTTDYGVFLLTRIKEARDSGLPNTEAVAHGLERTGRIVTSAALLMCIALGTLMISTERGLVSLGCILTLGVGCSMLSALVLLPAALELLSQREVRKETAESNPRKQAA